MAGNTEPSEEHVVAPSRGARRKRAYAFAVSILAVFIAPFLIPGLSGSILSTFTVGIILLAWLYIKWDAISSVPRPSRSWEVLLGSFLIIADFAENIRFASGLGLSDMLVVFAGLWIAFYGFRAVRLFVLPTIYIGILISGYLLEYHIPEVANLENLIASLMGSMMQSLGVQASVSQNTVILYDSNPIYLVVDGPCTGLQGILAFGLLASLTLLDVKATARKLVPLLAIGFIGAFLVNFARLAVIFLSFQWLGIDVGNQVHAYMGYLLFLAWVFVFWYFAFNYLAKGQSRLQTALPPPL